MTWFFYALNRVFDRSWIAIRKGLASMLRTRTAKFFALGTLMLGVLFSATPAMARTVPAHAVHATSIHSTEYTPSAQSNGIHPRPWSATTCGGDTCIYVNGTGDYVNYAVVTNNSRYITGQCTISDTTHMQTYYGPTCPPGHTWRKNYYADMKDNSVICGSISGLDVECDNIYGP